MQSRLCLYLNHGGRDETLKNRLRCVQLMVSNADVDVDG